MDFLRAKARIFAALGLLAACMLPNSWADGGTLAPFAGRALPVRERDLRLARPAGWTLPAEAATILNEARSAPNWRYQLNFVNRRVNELVRYELDQANYGRTDYWASPFETLDRRRGDCEDYAILKLWLFQELGFPSTDLRLVVVRDKLRKSDHAVLAVRSPEGWLILDNAARFGISDELAASKYEPLYLVEDRRR